MYSVMIRSKVQSLSTKARKKMQNFLYKENGDTNFISIVIVLVIVLVVASVFIIFKDKIMATASNAFNKFASIFGTEVVEGEVPST